MGTQENRGREGDGSLEVGVALRLDWGAREKCKIVKMLPSFINALEYYQKSSSDNIDNFFLCNFTSFAQTRRTPFISGRLICRARRVYRFNVQYV